MATGGDFHLAIDTPIALMDLDGDPEVEACVGEVEVPHRDRA